MRGRRSQSGFWRCAPALLLCNCSSVPVEPAASPEAPRERPRSPCAQREVEERVQEQQRLTEIERLRSELREHPDDAARWAKLGEAHGHDDTLAIDAFERATRLAPNVATYWKHLGQVRWSRAHEDPQALESAKAALLTCLQLDSQRADCHSELGTVLHLQGDHRAALQSYTQAAEHGAASEYAMAGELFDLGELEQSSRLVQAQLARIPARPDQFDQLYLLQDLEQRIAMQHGDLARAEAARQKRDEYALGVSPRFAFNLGTTSAIMQPPQLAEAKRLLERFIQSSCDAGQNANDCSQCFVARHLLARLAAAKP